MSRMLDVIIVDDELAGRRTLREFCAAESDLNVVGDKTAQGVRRESFGVEASSIIGTTNRPIGRS